MAETENFESYANRVLSGNNLLAGTENHLPKPILRDTIENHLAKYLSLKIDSLPSSEREHMIQLENLDDWLIFMRRLDDSARAELQRYKNLTTRKRGNDENQGDITIKRSCALPSTTDTALPNSQMNNRPPFSTTQHNRPSYHTNRPPYASGANALAYTGRSRVPRLTDDDREILELHHGCKKCRRFYVQHDHLNCPNNFPDTSLYTPLTQETAADTYKASQQPGYDAFHGIDITTMRVSRVALIFAWGGPASHNPLAQTSRPRPSRPPCRPDQRHSHQAPAALHTPQYTQNSNTHWPNRATGHKSFYIPRSKPGNNFFHSFSYPAAPTHRPPSPTISAHIEETIHTDVTATVPPQVPAAAAAIIPSVLDKHITASGGLTPTLTEEIQFVSLGSIRVRNAWIYRIPVLWQVAGQPPGVPCMGKISYTNHLRTEITNEKFEAT